MTIYLILWQQTEGETVEYAFSSRDLAEAKINSFSPWDKGSARIEEIDLEG